METIKSRKITVPDILSFKHHKKITALTVYDYSFAKLFDAQDIDVLLVGDSVANVIQGYPTTLPVTLDEIIYHTKAVCRAVRHSLVVADLPFMSYQVSPIQAVESAGRIIKESGAQAVKLEGGLALAETIAKLTSFDIPVMAHVGLTPQSVHRMGGHKIQGKTGIGKRSAELIMEDAIAVARAGAFAVVLEGIPEELARQITLEINIPTIGIGAGRFCDGQIAVMHDLLGISQKPPSFAKVYTKLSEQINLAVNEYIKDVRHDEINLGVN